MKDYLPWIVLAILLLVVPPFIGTYPVYLLNIILISGLVAVGLNILTGSAGLISLCQASFMAIGTYSLALLTGQYGLSFWLALPAAGLIAAAGGALLAIPAMRLTSLFLGLTTLGFLEITQTIITEFPDLTGGVRGIQTARPSFFGHVLETDLDLYWLLLAVTAFLVFVAANLLKSPVGRAFDAIRTSPVAAQSLGISLGRTKVIAFAVSAFYAGIAGALYATAVGFVDPTEFGTDTSLHQITFIVVGGVGSLGGGLLGAVVMTILPELLSGVQEWADLLYALVLLVFLIVLPGGLVGVFRRVTHFLLCAPSEADRELQP